MEGVPLEAPLEGKGGFSGPSPFLQGFQRTETHVGGSILFFSCSFSLRLVSMLPRPNRKAWLPLEMFDQTEKSVSCQTNATRNWETSPVEVK